MGILQKRENHTVMEWSLICGLCSETSGLRNLLKVVNDHVLQGPVSSKRLRQNFVPENVSGRFKDKNCVSSNSRNLGSSQILS